MTTAAPQAPTGNGSGSDGFDPNAYRKQVLQPLLAAGVVTLDDPFKLVGVDIELDDTALLRARIIEVVGFWQRERNSPRYKGLASELVKRRGELEAVLLDPQKRALARMRVQGVRRAQESARSARVDRLLRSVAQRHGGVPRSRLVLLERLALREGLTPEAFATRLSAYDVLDDGSGAEPLPDSTRLQVRQGLDELAMRGERARAASLWAFLSLSAGATTEEVELRHAELVGDNLARAHDRDKTVHADLLAHVKALLLDKGQRASYLTGLMTEVQDRVLDRVLELAVVDGELWPADVESLVRETIALGTGLTPEQARQVVRAAAASVGVPVTTGASAEGALCPGCQRAATTGAGPATGPTIPQPAVAPPPTQLPAGVRVQAQEEWRQAEREVGLKRLTHAVQRLARIQRIAPELAGPNGATPAQRLVEVNRLIADARVAAAAAAALPDLVAREQALYAVLDKVADCEEATAALAELPVPGPENLTAVLEGTTMRLRWSAPSGPGAANRVRTWSVARVTRDARGNRVEHQLGMTARCEAVDADLPRAGLVWHEVTAVAGGRRSATVATDAQPVVPDVSDLRVARDPDGVTLTWTAPAGSDVVIERRRTDDPEAPLRRARARGSRWRDTDIAVGATYTYVVRVEAAIGGVVARTPGCTGTLVIAVAGAAGAASEVLVGRPASAVVAQTNRVVAAPIAAVPAAPAAGGPVAIPAGAPGSDPHDPQVAPPGDASSMVVPVVAPPIGRGDSRPPPPPVGPPPAQDWTPPEAPADGGTGVVLALTPVPPGVVVTWTAPPSAEVTVLVSTATVGPVGSSVELGALPPGVRVIGFAVGSGSAFDVEPGLAAVYTPCANVDGRTVLGIPLRHVTIEPVRDLRVASIGAAAGLSFTLPAGCEEALVVWRRDRTPTDPADADGGEPVTAERMAADGGWVPTTDDGGTYHLLVLPVVHLSGEPVMGPGTAARLH